jgi:RNA polymerase sigma-B factor
MPHLVALPRAHGSDQHLMWRHRDGDQRARETLIERYLPLARRLALRYRRPFEPVDDLVQVASLGLVKAVDRWDPDRGLAFSSYAVPTILGELRRYFRDGTWDVRPPRRLQELCLSLEKAREDLNAATGREPTVAELARRLDRSTEEVVEALQAAEGRRVRSLDVPGHDEEHHPATADDLTGRNEGGYERGEARATIERLIPILDDREREVLRLRFEEDLRQAEIGKRIGCSQMQVSRIISTSLERLHEAGTQRAMPAAGPAVPIAA